MRASINKSNSYAWDCENRLIKVTYPGTGNYSTFAYDGCGAIAKILEYSAGSLTSTKQFVGPEERNASGTITKQFFMRGQTIGGVQYLYSRNHLGSVEEMTNISGAIQAQYYFDPYGQTTQLQGAVTSDFQYAGYYTHVPSGLGLTRTRGFSSKLGVFINRDTVDFKDGSNAFAYANGNPINLNDPSGMRGLSPVEKRLVIKWFGDCFTETEINTWQIFDTPYRSFSPGNGFILLNPGALAGELGHEVYHIEQANELGISQFDFLAFVQQAANLASMTPMGYQQPPVYDPYAFDTNQPILPQFVNGNVEAQGAIVQQMINDSHGDPQQIPSQYVDTYKEILRRCKQAKHCRQK